MERPAYGDKWPLNDIIIKRNHDEQLKVLLMKNLLKGVSGGGESEMRVLIDCERQISSMSMILGPKNLAHMP
jgi:hypothetical protein